VTPNITLFQMVKELTHEQLEVATLAAQKVAAAEVVHHSHLVMDMMPG
jgi:hypothetical protein